MCQKRAPAIEPIAPKVAFAGSYSSAEARLGALPTPDPTLTPIGPPPPAMRTRPPGSNVAVWLTRATVIEPVGLNVPVAGSYNSAVARAEKTLLPSVWPPVIKTRPLERRVAV